MEENVIDLQSELIALENGVDASKLFQDLEKITEETKNKLRWSRLPRYFLPQTILNRTSGGYIAPTAAKSFENSPSSYLYSMTIPYDKQSATYVGNSFHDVMEEFYSLEPDLRDKEHFDEIMKNIIDRDELEGRALKEMEIYCDGFWTAPDYIKGPNGEHLPMNHKAINTKLEYFAKGPLSPLGINLSKDPENIDSVPTYTKIDRIDFRKVGNEEKIYIIDYKTGMGNPRSYNLGIGGYLPQMIFYKWAVEATFNKPVEAVYMMLPGADDEDNKWVEMNVHSLVEQSKVIENVVFHLKHISEIRKTKIFPEDVQHSGHELGKNYYTSLMYKSRVPETKPGESIPIQIKMTEREFLEDALETEMITELPDNIQTLDQWRELSVQNNHAFENTYILNEEAKAEKENVVVLENLAGDDDDDW